MPLKDPVARAAYNAAHNAKYRATHREETKAYNAAYKAAHRFEAMITRNNRLNRLDQEVLDADPQTEV